MWVPYRTAVYGADTHTQDQEAGAEGGERQEEEGGWGPPTEASIQQEAKGGQGPEEETREGRLRAAGLVELRFVDPRPTDQLTYVADSSIVCAVEQLLEDGMIEMPEGRLMAAQGPPQTRRDGKICECRPGRGLLGLGGGQPQQQSCSTRATREAGEQQLQAPQRAHVMVVSVRR